MFGFFAHPRSSTEDFGPAAKFATCFAWERPHTVPGRHYASPAPVAHFSGSLSLRIGHDSLVRVALFTILRLQPHISSSIPMNRIGETATRDTDFCLPRSLKTPGEKCQAPRRRQCNGEAFNSPSRLQVITSCDGNSDDQFPQRDHQVHRGTVT